MLKTTAKSSGTKDLQTVKDLCGQLTALSQAQRKESKLKGYKDLNELQHLTEKIRMDEDMAIVEMETVLAIINTGMRKQILRNHLMAHMTDEKEMSATFQQHKDEFSQYIWKRRINAKRELRQLFQSGLGDLVSDAAIEGLLLFQKINMVRLCKDAIQWGLCDEDDVAGRLEFGIQPVDGKPLKESWHCVYGNQGPWAARLVGRGMMTAMVTQSLEQLYEVRDTDNFSFVNAIARLLDLVHPTHQLQANVLAYPLHASSVLKRRLLALRYDIAPLTEDHGVIDQKSAVMIVKQMVLRLRREQEFYYEFSYPNNFPWRIGYTMASKATFGDNLRYPGQDEISFGFGSDGKVFHRGFDRHYFTVSPTEAFFTGTKTCGVLVDLYGGTMSLVIDGQVLSPAFGRGSSFSPEEQEAQVKDMQSTVLIPMVAVFVTEKTDLQDKPMFICNFGRSSFAVNNLPATSCDVSCSLEIKRGVEATSIIDPYSNEGKERMSQDEEERLQMAAEKNYYRVTLQNETVHSFSQFPPNIYRRSLACTKIQRAWRRHRGRRQRIKLREEQYQAATLIQRLARRRLRKIRFIKDEAAARIQRNWRRRLFVWIALMRCIYQQPIPELHRAAAVIQTKWKHWSMFRNSPIAKRYNARIEDIIKAVNRIIEWWRPLCKRITHQKQMREKNAAACEIQRVFRGFRLRQLIRPDIRQRLQALGASVTRHRAELFRVRSAYVIQKAWRNYVSRKVRSDKIRTRNRAGAKIQAFWKGYWVRSHIHLRFTYGEAVFLTAVCKALRNCHFIIKMYRPCGIVCPKRETAFYP
ncbi:hypothetical protein HK101_003183 [Irineochytrium annulatum]|nr:hypothetical protein HK101_003183 [Irineochytrium annulatum]